MYGPEKGTDPAKRLVVHAPHFVTAHVNLQAALQTDENSYAFAV